MSRLFKKFYVFAIFIFGICFYALLKNSRVQDQSQFPKGGSINSNSKVDTSYILKHLDNLEGEIASQKTYSAALLDKLKAKYPKDKTPKPRTSKEVLGKGVGDKGVLESDKLLALQRELQQETHAGEVRSDIGEEEKENANKNKNKDEFANGEVIDDHPQQQQQSPLSNKDKKKMSSSSYTYSDEDSVIAVLVFVCDRPSIKRSLDTLFKYRPSEKKFPIIVSQDCGSHVATTQVLESYEERIIHIKQPDLSEITVPPKEKKMKGYYKIARHYGWALNYTFNILNHENVIIVEDDLEIAPDFFEYFAATLPIMRKDSTIWCVSAWNDNGKPKRINESAYDLLHRSDFFPGLGWMMTKNLWNELMVKWPKGYWDDWMREPAQRRDRVCIRPEISRTSTFGKEGVSLGTYYMNHLRFIKLNDHFVPFKSFDLSYLFKDNYDMEFVRRVYSSQLVNSVNELLAVTADTPQPKTTPIEYRIIYRTKADFRIFAKKLEIMEDFKAGVPRTAYRGVVPFVVNGYRCYLAPGANWESYQTV